MTESNAPKRTSEDIPVVRATGLQLAARTWRFSPESTSLVVIAKGSFALVQGGPASLLEDSSFPTGQLRVDDDPKKSCLTANDYALLKPRADVLLRGHAHAPSGRAKSSKVSFRLVGHGVRIEKSLFVVGPRRWKRTVTGYVPSEPEYFETVPLIYERAFGGPGHPSNPWGTGFGASPSLPNLELPGALVTSPTDLVGPACFAPLSLEAPQRWSKLGTYDREWFETRWPYFAEDFDASFFQDAPLDQQVDTLVGDEDYRIEGVHPTLAELAGRLPGIKARAFVLRRPSGKLEAVAMRLDTVTFDCDAMHVDLVWRGAAAVMGRDASDVQALFLAHEALDSTMTASEAQALFEATLSPAEVLEPPASDPAPPPVEEQADQAIDPEEQAIRDKLAAMGLVDELPDEAAANSLPPQDTEEVAAALRRAGAPEEEVAELLEALKDEAPPESEVRPADDAGWARRLVEDRRARGESLVDLDLAGSDLSDLDLRGADLSRSNLRGAKLLGARLDGADLTDAQLGGSELFGANLSESNLTRADFSEARLEKVVFSKAVIGEATFEGATADGADFAGARGEQTTFVGASLGSASFQHAELRAPDFSAVRAERANFEHATLTRARFYDADLRGASFDDATLTNFRGEGANLLGASLKGIDAEDSVFESSNLDRASMRHASLKGSSFVRATARKADFAQVDLREGRLAYADLGGSVFARANLMAADFDSANLVIADMRGSNLHAANLWEANLTDAQLGGALLTASTLARRPR